MKFRKSLAVKSTFLVLSLCLIFILSSFKPGSFSKISHKSNKTASSSFAPAPIVYVAKKPITLSSASNVTISGDSINGKRSVCITLNNCNNIHITKCKLMNSTTRGIFLNNCTNILIDSCFITNVAVGVYAHSGSGIRVVSNDFLNMRGPLPAGNFVQFNNVSGAGNQINYNKCEDIVGTGPNPYPQGGDGLSIFQSNGTAASPIQVYGNWIRGGGTNTGTQGMAGIVAGDVGGSYQDIENNILVNTGYVGIQQQGGSYMTITHNTIYSDLLPYSGLGLGSANYSGVPSVGSTIAYNTIEWKAGYALCGCNFERDTAYKPGSGVNSNARPIGWNTNIVKASLGPNILPVNLISEYDYTNPPKVKY